jgi:hypothetical protein
MIQYKQHMNELRIFEPFIFYLFILKRTLNPSIYYEDDEIICIIPIL